ncbi:MAG: hypothetical protein ACFBWO_11060 [Paracoccaceae bacterium]
MTGLGWRDRAALVRARGHEYDGPMVRWWFALRAVVLVVMAFAVAAGQPGAMAPLGGGHHAPAASVDADPASAHAVHHGAATHHAMTHDAVEGDPAERAPAHSDCGSGGACCPAAEAATPVPTVERLARRLDRAPPEAVDASSRPRLPDDRPPRRA